MPSPKLINLKVTPDELSIIRWALDRAEYVTPASVRTRKFRNLLTATTEVVRQHANANLVPFLGSPRYQPIFNHLRR